MADAVSPKDLVKEIGPIVLSFVGHSAAVEHYQIAIAAFEAGERKERERCGERVSVLERALREIMVEVERFEDSEVVVILSPEVRQLAAETERNTL